MLQKVEKYIIQLFMYYAKGKTTSIKGGMISLSLFQIFFLNSVFLQSFCLVLFFSIEHSFVQIYFIAKVGLCTYYLHANVLHKMGSFIFAVKLFHSFPNITIWIQMQISYLFTYFFTFYLYQANTRIRISTLASNLSLVLYCLKKSVSGDNFMQYI